MKDLISVVIPVYNVEKYLDKCLNSVTKQTYKNLEIIIVDDETKDNSNEIIENYRKKDKRIKVIHQKNGGLSCARNSGIKKASGEYITFLDSDDYLEFDMYEHLLNCLKNNNADIAICNFIEELEDEPKKVEKEDKYELLMFSKMDALHQLILDKKITNHAWNKLYKLELFNNVEYPNGRNMEDIATTYKLFEKCDKIVYSSKIGYHYIQRSSSIMGNLSKKRILETEKSYSERNEYLIKKYPILKEQIDIDNLKLYKTLCYLAALGDFNELLDSNKYNENYLYFKNNYKYYIKKMKTIFNSKTMFSFDVFAFNYKIYIYYTKILKKIKEVFAK